MIMNVVMNRLADPNYPDTICGVIKQHKQFSWTHDGRSDKMTETGQVKRLEKLVDNYLINKNTYLTTSEGVDHYHKVGHKTNWNYRVLDYIGRFDNHVFYRHK